LLELFCPSAFPDDPTLFSRPSGSRPQSVALNSGRSTLRVWLPSQRLVSRSSLGTFHPQRSWASLFRAFLHLHGRICVSTNPLRSCAFLKDFPSLLPALQRLAPTVTAVPFFAPQRFRSGQGPCSLELSRLSGSLVSALGKKLFIPFLPFPLALPLYESFNPHSAELQGF
jgi:hypothetical protein